MPCSTSRICPSWPRPRVRLSPFLTHSYLVSTLFVLAHPAACCLSQGFIFHTWNPPLTTRWLKTFIQVKITGAWDNMYNEHIHNVQHFFLYLLLTSGQAGWPQTFKSGTVRPLWKIMETYCEATNVWLGGQGVGGWVGWDIYITI
jgi:hypothetical protein